MLPIYRNYFYFKVFLCCKNPFTAHQTEQKLVIYYSKNASFFFIKESSMFSEGVEKERGPVKNYRRVSD